MYQKAAKATVRIENGPSRGSGFQFMVPGVYVTCRHVLVDTGSPIYAVTDEGSRATLVLLGESGAGDHDFAVLKCADPSYRIGETLQPKVVRPSARGQEVLFAGFPHGIPHLLVQRAVVSGLISEDVFYLDGSVNGGNSGGPVLDASDGTVVGIVTQRRFLGAQDLGRLRDAAERLRKHCESIAGRGGVSIMGIDFGSFSKLMAEGMLLVREVLEANANSGIGIGFSIAFVDAECRRLGLTA